MTLIPHTSSQSVQIRNGVGMAVSLQGMRVHERLSLPDCTVSLPMLKFALASAPDGFTAQVAESHLELTAPGFCTKIPLLVEPELPPAETHARVFTLDCELVKRLSVCCALKEPTREILEYVQIKKGYAAASNGRILVMATGLPDCELEIHRSHLSFIGDGDRTVSVSEKSVCVQDELGAFWFPRPVVGMDLVDGCRKLDQHVSGSSAAVKTDDVITAVRTASQIVEKIEIKFLPDLVQIHTPDNAAYFSQEVIAKTSLDSVACVYPNACVNPKYLLACLQAVGEEFVDLFISPYLSMAVKGQKAHAVCMGMRKS